MTRTNAEIRAEGEQHVIAELRRRGIPHRLEPRSHRIDIVVPSVPSSHTLQVRVTSLGHRQGWLVTKELEGDINEHLLYAFVNTQPPLPETFLIPAAIVVDVLRKSHAAWLASLASAAKPTATTRCE